MKSLQQLLSKRSDLELGDSGTFQWHHYLITITITV